MQTLEITKQDLKEGYVFDYISGEQVKAVITSKWEAIEKIDNLKQELGDLIT